MATYPLQHTPDRVIPFPTLYWLTCPHLQSAVANLERLGVIRQLQQRLTHDPDLHIAMRHDHDAYIQLRWNTLTPQDQALIQTKPALLRLFQTRGIGGSANPTSVKCLHMHVAHELACSNTIGRWLLQHHNLDLCA